MAGFRRQAQLQAAAQVAPEYAALGAALSQAIAERDTAIHSGRAAFKGISGAIHKAGPRVKKAYSNAQGQSAAAEGLANQTFASLGPSAAPFAAASAREKAVGINVLAQSKANAQKELSDRRIQAAAGAAFAHQKAVGNYAAKSSEIAQKHQQVAQREGLYAANALAKLEQHQADQQFQATQNAIQRNFQGHENALSRRTSTLNSIRGARAVGARQEDQQAFQAGENRKSRAQQRSLANAGKGAARPPEAVFKGRNAILAVEGKYRADTASGKKLHEIAADARKNGVAEPILAAGADRATKGYITPYNVKRLQQLGIDVPKEWQGVQVRPHTRKRRK